MWKIYLIEFVGNFSTLLLVISIIIFILIVFISSDLVGDDGIIYTTENYLWERRVVKLFAVMAVSVGIYIMIPSKKFMYTALGISETINFIQGNEEIKKISGKTLKVINNKLDKYLKEEDETN